MPAIKSYDLLGRESFGKLTILWFGEHLGLMKTSLYRDGARHPRHLNARVSALLLLK